MSRECPPDWFEFIEGALPADKRQELEAHLSVCSACRERYEKDRQILERLSRSPADMAQVDLVPAIRARLEDARRRKPGRPLLVCASAIATACLVGIALFFFGRDETRVKSSGSADSERWTGIEVYYLKGNEIKPLRRALPADAELAFAYTNESRLPFSHLMIFAVDARGNIHWFYPAYENVHSDPESIVAQAGHGIELPEKIKAALAPGKMRLFGLFSRKPLRVKEIEVSIQAAGEKIPLFELEKLPIEETFWQVLDVEVTP